MATKLVPLPTWEDGWPSDAIINNVRPDTLYATKIEYRRNKPAFLHLLNSEQGTRYRFRCSDGFWKHVGKGTNLTNAKAKISKVNGALFLKIHLATKPVTA